MSNKQIGAEKNPNLEIGKNSPNEEYGLSLENREKKQQKVIENLKKQIETDKKLESERRANSLRKSEKRKKNREKKQRKVIKNLKSKLNQGVYILEEDFQEDHKVVVRRKITIERDVVKYGQNDLELRVYSPLRFGHHAIINWIAHCFKKNQVFFFDTSKVAEEVYSERNLTNYTRTTNKYNGNSPTAPYFDEGDYKNMTPEDLVRMDKKCIIHSYQRPKIEKIPIVTRKKCGASKATFDIIVIRDPYNHLASAFVQSNVGPRIGAPVASKKDVMNQIKHIKEFYKEALNKEFLPNGVVANYNKWMSSEKYRRELADTLGIEFSDTGKTAMGHDGSSFDAMDFDGRADKMEVLTRWKRVYNEPWFKLALNDEELKEISEKLFGKEFVDNIYEHGENENGEI